MVKSKLTAVALAVALCGASSLCGCAALQSSFGGLLSPAPTATPAPTAEPTPEPTPGPTPEPAGNLLTGMAADITGQRPIAVQLRAEDAARPQWGIERADILIEGVTEGKRASMMAIFPAGSNISKVGPIAPARDLMLQFALPLNAIPVHIDKGVYASNLLNALSYQDLDGYHIGTAGFAIDEGRLHSGYPEEDCWYTTSDLLTKGLSNYGMDTAGNTMLAFDFGERKEPETRNGTDLFLTFSDSDTEELVYSNDAGLYLKNNTDGSPAMDADSSAQASFTNVLVLYASSGIKDDGYTRDYDLSGGTGLYLTKGGFEQINWTKGDATAPLVLKDSGDKSLKLNPGKTFIGIYGGYYGQKVELYGEDGTLQTLPDAPALMESGIPNDVAATAESAYREQQEAIAASEAAILEANATPAPEETEGEPAEGEEASDSQEGEAEAASEGGEAQPEAQAESQPAQ